MVSEEPTTEMVTIDPKPCGCCQFCADESRLLRQHEIRLINVATQQDLARMSWRLRTLSIWYIAGWVLIVLMIFAAVMLQHFWR